MTSSFKIGARTIGASHPSLVIAEVAQAHDGSLGMAHAYIDAVARAGAGAIKFQTHIAAAESTPEEPWRVKFSPQDATRYDYWKRMEFTEEQWQGLKRHADELGLLFLSSPFSLQALELLERLDVPAWKVASGETSNAQMLDRMVATARPILLSTGMNRVSEIDRVVGRITGLKAPLAVFQCTSAYPCPPEKIGLNVAAFFRQRYGCPVGLSDHSGTIFPALAAAAVGIELIEVHVTFSREMFGPDVPASVTPAELRQMTEGIRFIEKMNAHPLDKSELPEGIAELRRIFSKSVVAAADLPAGALLTEENLALKKPGTGMPADRLPLVVGRRLRRAVKADQLISEADLEERA